MTSLAVAQDEPPVAFQPERVTIALHFADSPELLPGDRDRIVRDIKSAIRRLIGSRWDVAYRRGTRTRLPGESLARLTVDELPIDRLEPSKERPKPSPSDTAPDKFFVVFVEPFETGFKVAVREWDRLADSLGGVASEYAVSRDDIARAVATSVIANHRPVAIVEKDEKGPRLTFRGAALPTPDPGLLAPAGGTLFRVVLRRRNREGVLMDVRPLPYTYLVLKELDGIVGTAAIHSALRSPLGARRGRITAWAIAIPPIANSTELTLRRETDGLSLAGRRVEIRLEPFQPDKESTAPIRELLTDRSGTATLVRDPEHPLVWATIKSGQATLMRIPIAPGTEPRIELLLGNDQRRLDAEGRLAILTGELVETVAKRATLLAKARRSARNGNFEDAQAALDQAEELPAAKEFRRRLAAIATPAANAAEQAGQRMTAARIRALASKTAQLIDSYLGPEPLRIAREEIEELEEATRE